MSEIDNFELTPQGPFHQPLIDTHTKDGNFQVELNIGLALPFRYHFDSKSKGDSHSSIVRDVAPDGSLYLLEIITQSPDGPLQAVEFDVLIILMTLLVEQNQIMNASEGVLPRYSSSEVIRRNPTVAQNGVRVQYTLAELCRRLGISADSSSRVKKAIERIESQSLTFKRFSYSVSNKTNSQSKGLYNNEVEKTKIILKSGKIKYGKVEDTYSNSQSVFWVELDQSIVNNLLGEYVSIVTQKEFISLSSGNQRRIIFFLHSKKKKFGNSFIVSLNEIAQVIGLADNQKKRRQIGEYLEKIKSITLTFDFSILKRKLENDWDITIKFNSENLVEIESDPFWSLLIQDYGLDNLSNVDFTEIDTINFRKEFDQKYFKLTGINQFEYMKKKYHPGEFAIDLTLWQVIRTNYPVTKGIKPLAFKILESLATMSCNFPDKYRSFVQDRVEERKKIETQLAISKFNTDKELIKKEEDKRFEKSFEQIYQHVITDKDLNELLFKIAEQKLLEEGSSHQTLLDFPTFVNLKKREVAREMMNGMELFDDIKELKKKFFPKNDIVFN
jgi:hypothetical protein